MPEASPARRRHPSLAVYAAVGFVLLLVVLLVWGVVAVVQFFRAPSILDEMPVATRDTTQGLPLASDGSVDYLAAFNADFGEGATPENNAAVLALKAFGSEIWSDKSEEEAAESATGTRAALGLPADEPLPDTWLSPYEFVDSGRAAEVTGGEEVDDYEIEELDNKSRERPWHREEYLVYAVWLEENADAFDLLVEASKRERWFWPAVAGTSRVGLAGVELPIYGPLLEGARGLAARAMLEIAEGEAPAACEDAFALRRLGRLIRSQDGFITGRLVGAALEDLVVDTELAIALAGSVSPELKKRLAVRILSLREATGHDQVLDTGERWMAHGVLVGQFQQMGTAQSPQGIAVARQVLDGWYDRSVAACQLDTWADRSAALQAIEADMDAVAEQFRSKAGVAGAMLQGGDLRQKPLKMMGLVCWAMCAPPLHRYCAEQIAATQRGDISALALVLAVHKAENGDYPDALSDLAPDLLEEVPADRFTEGDLIYRPTADGYILYSLGPNMADDGGPNEDTDVSDDVGVTMTP